MIYKAAGRQIQMLRVQHNMTQKELADKLELIRAMAEFNDYSLEDIIEEADIKREKRGGFQKKLLLEKVVDK